MGSEMCIRDRYSGLMRDVNVGEIRKKWESLKVRLKKKVKEVFKPLGDV